MSYKERQEYYKEIEKTRHHPLIVYVTSVRPHLSSYMAGDSIPFVIEQINQIDAKEDEVDFLVVSNGGDAITVLRINSILRERFKRINVLVPYVAYSAATIFALGADHIIMGPFSNLGPVDPQITSLKRDKQGGVQNLQFGTEDLRHFIEFVKKDIKLRKEKNKLKAFESLISEVGACTIGFARRSWQLSFFLSKKLLSGHGYTKYQISKIASRLNLSYHNHGYAVCRGEAAEIGLHVEKPDSRLEDLMWKVWRNFEDEMRCRIPFDPISEVVRIPEMAKIVKSIPVVSIPANLPREVKQALAQDIVNKIKPSTQASVPLSNLMASIESSRLAYSLESMMDIVIWRDYNLELMVNVTNHYRWEEIKGV